MKGRFAGARVSRYSASAGHCTWRSIANPSAGSLRLSVGIASATHRTADAIAGAVDSFVARVFDGAVQEYLVHALESRKLSSDELNELEQMIADAKRKAEGGKSGE